MRCLATTASSGSFEEARELRRLCASVRRRPGSSAEEWVRVLRWSANTPLLRSRPAGHLARILSDEPHGGWDQVRCRRGDCRRVGSADELLSHDQQWEWQRTAAAARHRHGNPADSRSVWARDEPRTDLALLSRDGRLPGRGVAGCVREGHGPERHLERDDPLRHRRRRRGVLRDLRGGRGRSDLAAPQPARLPAGPACVAGAGRLADRTGGHPPPRVPLCHSARLGLHPAAHRGRAVRDGKQRRIERDLVCDGALRLGRKLDLGMPTAGPPMGRIDYGCLGTAQVPGWAQQCASLSSCASGGTSCQYTGAPQELFDRTYGAGPNCLNRNPDWATTWHEDSVVSPNAELSYPQTMMRFVYGTADCSEAETLGRLYASAITSDSGIVIVPGAPHAVPSVAAGAQAIFDVLSTQCVPRHCSANRVWYRALMRCLITTAPSGSFE